MAIITGQFNVTSTPQDFNTDPGPSSGGPTSILIRNTGSTTVYVGGTNAVSTTTGFPVDAGAAVALDFIGPNDVFVVAASTGTIAFLYERNS